MISERKFAKTETAFWNNILPFGNYYAHRLNKIVEKFAAKIAVHSHFTRRALIAEVAFEHFIQSINTTNKSQIDIKDISLRGPHFLLNILNEQKNTEEFSIIEKREIEGISGNLHKYFKGKDKSKVLLRPALNGCGIINNCEGDFIYEDSLIEVKSVDRGIGIFDVRQVLVYLTLQYASSEKVSKYVIFLNPRRGVSIKISTSELILLLSGRETFDLLGQIVLYVSDLSPMLEKDSFV